MKLEFWSCELRLTHHWAISGRQGSGVNQVVIVRLTTDDGVYGLGEAAPADTYGESASGVLAFCQKVDATRLACEDIPGSMQYLDTVAPGEMAAKCAFNIALLDLAAKRAQQPLYDFLGLGFRENHHVTSFSIGIDKPVIIRQKTLAAARYPILKLKVGDARDAENLAALRETAPAKRLRVDANEAWKTKEEALTAIDWLARDSRIEFIEQPMPARNDPEEFAWLKERSPIPIFGDESCHTVRDISRCAECFHGVNVKLVKTGGVSMAFETLKAAREAGLKTMLGCMIETSVLISAAAHLANLTDYLDLDGNLLITNDPYAGVTAEAGMLSFAGAASRTGLRVTPREGQTTSPPRR